MENEVFKFRLKGKTLVIIDWANVYGWSKKLGWEVNPEKLYNYLKSYPEIFDIRFYFGVDVDNEKSKNFQEEIKNIGYNFITKEVKWVPVFLEEQSHLRRVMKNLFNVLNNLAQSNSEISTKLYQLKCDFEQSIKNSKPIIDGEIDEDGQPVIHGEYPTYDEKAYNNLFNLIEEIDDELKKLNIDIINLQKELKQPLSRRKCDFDCEISLDIINNLGLFDSLILFSGDGDYKVIVEYLLDKKKQVIVVHPFGVRGKEYNELLERKVGNKPYLCAVEKLTEFIHE